MDKTSGRCTFTFLLMPLFFLVTGLGNVAYAVTWGHNQYDSIGDDNYPGVCSERIAYLTSVGYVAYQRTWSRYNDYYNETQSFCDIYYTGDVIPPEDMPEEPVQNLVYSDEQCRAQYGESATSTGEVEDGSGNGCNVPPPVTPEDEQCQALTSGTTNFLTLPSDPGTGFTWSAGGCEYKITGPWLENSEGEYTAPYESTGATPDATEGDISDTPTPPTEGQDTSGNYTPTDDPATDCPASNVTYDGQSYCYQNNSGIPDGIDWPDTDYEGSTDADGNPLGQGDGDPDGDGQGDSTNGDIVGGIGNLGDMLRSGFDGLVDSLTESVPSVESRMAQTGLDDAFGTVGEGQDAVSDAFDEARSGSGTGSGIGSGASSPIADPIANAIPDIGGGGCSALEFGDGAYTLTISCQGANTVSAWLEWILYFWTAVSIVDLFFDARRTA